ncbi:hypothetical protein QCA50_010746 [Cerrena zonata]|uniref:Uncharacterized protein n=1 Tax=Cerrena zonata TaxID=2478898 RepID=A0AAW0G346_9APHY
MVRRVAPDDNEVASVSKRRRVTGKPVADSVPAGVNTEDPPVQTLAGGAGALDGADAAAVDSSEAGNSEPAVPQDAGVSEPSSGESELVTESQTAPHNKEVASAGTPEPPRPITPDIVASATPLSPATPTPTRSRTKTYTSPTKVVPATIVRAVTTLASVPFRPLPLGFRPYLTDDAVQRLNKALRYSSQVPPVYAVSRLPEKLFWATRPEEPEIDMSQYIMQGKHRVKVLVIGEIKKGYLMGTVTNKGSASVKIKPLLVADGNRLDTIMKGFATSSAVVDPQINAVGLHMSKSVGVNNVFFTDLYDGRDGYKKKTEMEKLTMDQFRPADIVFAEGYIQRYCYWVDGKKKMDGDAVDWAQSPYRVGIELTALSLVATPRDFEVESEEEPEVDL